MKRTPLKRSRQWKKKPSEKGKTLFPYLNKESKTQKWDRIREELKKLFIYVGILACELRFEGCTIAANFSLGWSFAHSFKRNHPEYDDYEVCYACQSCHGKIEKIGNKERFDGKMKMEDYVRAAISRRKISPQETSEILLTKLNK